MFRHDQLGFDGDTEKTSQGGNSKRAIVLVQGSSASPVADKAYADAALEGQSSPAVFQRCWQRLLTRCVAVSPHASAA